MKHTPGPWTFDGIDTIGSDDVGVAIRLGIQDDNYTIGGKFDTDAMASNAALICAAPDLLAACKKALGAILKAGDEHIAETTGMNAAIVALTDAIQKASPRESRRGDLVR